MENGGKNSICLIKCKDLAQSELPMIAAATVTVSVLIDSGRRGEVSLTFGP